MLPAGRSALSVRAIDLTRLASFVAHSLEYFLFGVKAKSEAFPSPRVLRGSLGAWTAVPQRLAAG